MSYPPTRATQVARLQAENPTAAARNADKSIFDIGLRLSSGHVLTLRVELPPTFPHSPPSLCILDKGVVHPWLDGYGRVVRHASLNAWQPAADLGMVVKEAVNEFCVRPPRLGGPAGLGGEGGGPAAKQDAHDERVALPSVPSSFSELESLSREDLQELLDSDEAFEEFFQGLEMVKNVTSLRNQMRANNASMAQKNLARKAEIDEVQAEARAAQDELRAKIGAFNQLSDRHHQVSQRYEPSHLAAQLESLAHEVDEQSEALVSTFMQGDIPMGDFVHAYREMRVRYHRRHSIAQKDLGPDALVI